VLGFAALLVAGGAVAALTLGGSSPAKGSIDNSSPTALASVRRETLTSQTQVDATLGYAGSATIAVPSGTAPSAMQQAKQAADQAEASLQTAEAMLAADSRAAAQARATLAADRQRAAVDCAGANATSASCATAAQAVTTDTPAAQGAADKVTADQRQVAAAQSALADANASLAEAAASETSYGQAATYTALPKVGAVVHRGEPLYEIGGEPVLLLYGSTAAWRAFVPGMTPGNDVAELNVNLGVSGSAFTAATQHAIEQLQAAHGLPATGSLPLGSVVFQPGAVRVTAVTPSVGAPVQAGAVLTVTSLKRVVTIALDATQQSSVKVGDPVIVTLPDNSTTTGRVSLVGTVATTPSNGDQGNGNSTPTIEVDVALDHPAATGTLDQAPVSVSITTATARNVLVVPVNALLALASGGYAVETSAHQLISVSVGLFDDSQGLVEINGSGLRPGQRVVVPAS
jgi:hypothetical protein